MNDIRTVSVTKGSSTGSSGFTLVETVIAVGLLTLLVGLLWNSFFEALSIQRFWTDDVTATKEIRHAQSWFAGDALNAKSTNLIAGAPPASTVALTWTNNVGATQTATYTLSGTSLIRDFNGKQIVIARRVDSVGFSLSGNVLGFDLTVKAERGGTEQSHLDTYLRGA